MRCKLDRWWSFSVAALSQPTHGRVGIIIIEKLSEISFRGALFKDSPPIVFTGVGTGFHNISRFVSDKVAGGVDIIGGKPSRRRGPITLSSLLVGSSVVAIRTPEFSARISVAPARRTSRVSTRRASTNPSRPARTTRTAMRFCVCQGRVRYRRHPALGTIRRSSRPWIICLGS